MYNIIYETSCQSRFDARYWMLGAGALGRPRGMVWRGRREEGSGWGTRVCLWWIHFDIWQNQYNIVKFKNKIKLKKKKDGDGLVAKSCPTLATPWTVACKVPLSMDFPGKNTGVGCHFLLQRIFWTQELNLGLLHCRQILYRLSYKGSMFQKDGIDESVFRATMEKQT